MMWFSWMMPFRWFAFSLSPCVLPPAEPNATLEEVFGMSKDKGPWGPEPAEPEVKTPEETLVDFMRRAANFAKSGTNPVPPGDSFELKLLENEQAAFDSLETFEKAARGVCDAYDLEVVFVFDSLFIGEPEGDEKKSVLDHTLAKSVQPIKIEPSPVWEVMFIRSVVRAPKVD